MNRTEFIKGIAGASIFGWLGLQGKNQMQKTKESKIIYQSFVRGFVHSTCFVQLASMQPNEILNMVREPNNEYDSSALALYYKNQKVGYVPAEDNYIISQMMDSNHGHFTAEIANVHLDAPTWEQVEFRILSYQ